MIGYDEIKRLSGLVFKHEEDMRTIGLQIDNFMEICEIAKNEYDAKRDWAMSNIDRLKEKRDILQKDYIEECKAVYDKYRNGSMNF